MDRMQMSEWGQRLVGDIHGRMTTSGWASLSLRASLTRASAVAIGVWQVVVLGAIVVEPGPVLDHWQLVCAHVALLLLAAAVFAGQRHAWLLIPMAYALVLWDWAIASAIDSPLCFAACWLANYTHFLLTFLLRGRVALVAPAVVAVSVPAALIALRPEWGPEVPMAVFVTVLAITVAIRFGLSFLFDLAREADLAEERSREEAHRGAVKLASSRRAAEDARVVHDTVVNTLSAIVRGGAAVADRAAVRERCAADVATVEALDEGRASLPYDELGIREIASSDSIAVRHTGMDDEDLAAWEQRLPRHVVDALGRAAAELVRNAAKHSGAPEVRVDIVHREPSIVVTVTDRGRGSSAGESEMRGLLTSVAARIQEVGGDLDHVSRDGHGTRAVLTVPTHHAPVGRSGGVSAEDFGRMVDQLRLGASFMLAVGLAVVGVFLAAANHPGELSAEYGMAAVVGVTAAISWWWHARYGVLPPLIRAMLMLAAPLAFILTAASVGFARDEVVLWQALGPLGPLLVLVAVAKSPYRALLTTLPHWLTVVALAAVIAASDEPGATNAAYCTLVAGLIGLVAFGGWFYFHLTTEAIAMRAVEDQRALFWARTERLAQAAAVVARRRWRAMGLTACLALLRGLADGRLDPADPAVRAACADEEHYLRQLTQLDPDLVRMGQWFGRGLAEARSQGVELNVRTGAADLDDELADACGQLLLGVVGIVPAQHSMTSTLFGLESEMRFTILGPHPQASGVVESWEAPPGVEVSTRHFGAQDLIEVVATDVSRPYRRT